MFSSAYRHYVLFILMSVYMLNLLDRNLMVLLLEPIRNDLHLSDTQLGLLTGIAFALFYATIGIPVARWSDRGKRVTIASIALALWAVVMMAYLYVGTFSQMILARVASAVGESGCMPPTYSLVGDYFPAPAERVRGMTIYWLASPLASLISFAAGGLLNEHLGWRKTFCVMAIPALIIAVAAKLTITEPRHSPSIDSAPPILLPQKLAVFAALWRSRSSRHLCLAIILLYTLSMGMAPWYGAFLIRSHGITTAQLGIWFSVIFGFGGIAGILLGGSVAERCFAADERAQLLFSAAMLLLVVPSVASFLLISGNVAALLSLVPVIIGTTLFLGPTFALLQRLVPNNVRAIALSVVMLLANLIGMGIGPLVVGRLSDVLSAQYGNDSLRYAMLAFSAVSLWPIYHLVRASSTVRSDLALISRQGSESDLGNDTEKWSEQR
jgi:MFS family permease